MRPLPVIFVAALAALVIATVALVTSHFTTTDWPTAPAPRTSTALVTPAEADRRATSDRAEHRPAAREQADRAPGARTEATGGDSPARAPSADQLDAEGGDAHPSPVTRDPSPVTASPATPSPVTRDPSPMPAPAPAASPLPVLPDPVTAIDEVLRAREHDLPGLAPAEPVGDQRDEGGDGPLRDLLEELP